MLLDGNCPDVAASRAYYAMFDIAEAFLEGEGMSFSKHSAVISAVESLLVPTEYLRNFTDF